MKEPNLKCPMCKVEFYSEVNVYDEYSITCPTLDCYNSEEACNSNIQYFEVIKKS